MKTSKIILIATCAFSLNMPIHAQFNTIGTVNSKHIKTVNPSKPNETLTDHTLSADTVSNHLDSGNKVNWPTADASMGGMDVIQLVSLPLKNIHINSGFGMRMHPICHKRIMHNGIDLSARYENVYSMFPGIVIKVGQDNRSGKFVTIRTGNYTISYCHLSQQLVHENDFVNPGSKIAVSGNSGASTGPHLHLTTKKDGKAFDPSILLNYVNNYK